VKHPSLSLDTKFVPGPEWPWRIVHCAECGAMEWWTEDELRTHGHCRNSDFPCRECHDEPLIWADAVGVA
jgi:hypothetical protein